MKTHKLASFIDHTCLKPEATESDIRRLCEEALQYQFKGVCVERRWLNVSRDILKGSNVELVTVVDFPKGEGSKEIKIKETQEALNLGATEIDMVLNRALLFQYEYDKLWEEIQSVVSLCGSKLVKVILETSELSSNQIITASSLCIAAGAFFVKTSTGFSKSGAKIEDVALMRHIVGPHKGVKASGGIKNLATAVAMIEAGASRLGLSSSVQIIKEL